MRTLIRIAITGHLLLASLYPLVSAGSEAVSTPLGKVLSTACDDSLDILLSNDDGFNKPGIIALQQALSQARHRVVLAAPAKNASGSSASITFSPVNVEQVEANTYAISASPATSVVLAVSALYPPGSPPDLVISGINKGANLGPATGISGTVGATTAAIQVINPPIPAIAISTDPLGPGFSEQQNTEHLQRISAFIVKLVDRLLQRQCESGELLPKGLALGPNFSEKQNTEHLQRISAFIVKLVDRLLQERCKSGELLPKGLALNINYPPLPPREIKGIVMKEQGQAPYFKISYAPSKDDAAIYLPIFKTQAVENDTAQSDTLAYHQGYITVVPLDGNYTRKDPAMKALLEPLIVNIQP